MKRRWQEILISPSTAIKDAIRAIDKGAMGIALVVDEQRRLAGTVTDGDIRRGILRGLDLEEPVKKLMNSNPITVKENVTKEELLSLMRENSIRQIPILDAQSKVIGISLLSDLIITEGEKEKANPVVILAGGLGSRLRPLTEEIPKPLLKVGGKPILELMIEQLASHGFKNIFISVCYKAQRIKEYFGDGNQLGVRISYLEEDEFTGTAAPLRLLRGHVKEPFIVINGDLLTKIHFGNLIDFHNGQGFDLTVGIKKYEFKVPYGIIQIEEEKIIDLKEKPIQSFFVNAGVYVLNPEVLEYIPEGQHFDMPELIKLLLKKGKGIGSFPIHEYWLDIGQIQDYEQAQEDAKNGI